MAELTPAQQAILDSWAVDCSKGAYFPNPEDAGSFLECKDGVPYVTPCPPGQVYDPAVEPSPVCVLPRDLSDQAKAWYAHHGISIKG